MSDFEAPEADAQEQAEDVSPPATTPGRPHIDDEVPEADAIEQAQPAPLDEDDYEGA